MSQSLPALFGPTFAGRSGDVALEFGGRTFTFGEIDRRANQTARILTARGLVAGDRLAIYLENRVEIIDLFLACTRLGIIALPINILYREREIGHIVGDAAPKAIIAAAPLPGGHSYWDVTELARAAESQPPDAIASAVTAESPAAIVYTSGTTGTAKGAILSHDNFAANAQTLVEAWRMTNEDRLLLPLPLFHVHGLGNGVCSWLASGCRMRLLDRFDYRTAADQFLEFRPTVFFAVPTIYVRLLSFTDGQAAVIGRGVRLFVSGSAPLPAHVFQEFERKFGQRILERYGMTETMMNIGNPLDGPRLAGTVGLPLPGVSVRIVPPDRTADGGEAAADEPGEVQIKGRNVFAGYWNRPDATRDTFVDGWFRTGDIGVRSADGYITLRGRMGDVIICGGFNIYPREIEEVLLEEPGVREAAVIGVTDEVRGEVPVAYVAVDDSFDEAATRERLAVTLASFKLPRAFVRVDALPRTALGKIQRHLLPAWEGQRAEGKGQRKV